MGMVRSVAKVCNNILFLEITTLHSTELLKLCREKYNLNFCPGEMYAF